MLRWCERREVGDQRHGGFHMHAVADHARQAYAQTLEATTAIHAFGTPTGDNLRILQQQAGSGIPLSINPLRLGGSPVPGKPDGLAPTTPNVFWVTVCRVWLGQLGSGRLRGYLARKRPAWSRKRWRMANRKNMWPPRNSSIGEPGMPACIRSARSTGTDLSTAAQAGSGQARGCRPARRWRRNWPKPGAAADRHSGAASTCRAGQIRRTG
jgi:hypothetical protein